MRTRLGRLDPRSWDVRFVALAGAAALLALGVVGATFLSGDAQRQHDLHHDVEHARLLLEQTQSVFSLLQDAETGGRGYILTGMPEYLQPYESARRALPVELERLRLLADNDRTSALTAQLNAFARERLEIQADLIAVFEEQGTGAAVELLRTGEGRRQMDAVRDITARIRRLAAVELDRHAAVTDADAARLQRNVAGVAGTAGLIMVAIWLLLARQIAEQRRLRTIAQGANDLQAAVFDALPQGVCLFDREHRIAGFNGRFLALRKLDPDVVRVGLSIGEVVQRGAAISMLGDELKTRLTSVLPAVLRHEPLRLEFEREDGAIIELQGHPILDDHYLCVYTDVTDLRRSELVHREQAVRLAATLDSIVDAIITINESGCIESWSRGAERMFGYTAEDVRSRDLAMLMPDVHAVGHRRHSWYDAATSQGSSGRLRRQLEGERSDGTRFPVELRVSEMFIGSRRRFICVVRDIADRLEAERAKREFVSTVSHELRTPLTSIAGALGLLSGGAAGELQTRARRLVDIASQNAERLVRLVNDILDVERLEAGQVQLDLQKLDLASTVADVIRLNEPFAERYDVAVSLEVLATGAVLADRDRLQQVLTNLLSNAVKFSSPGEKVCVQVDRSDDHMRVRVTDQGPGIPEDFRARIFQRFAQGDSSDARLKGGTGLGLAICRDLMRRLGGSIEFETREGCGTTFTICLPAVVQTSVYQTKPSS